MRELGACSQRKVMSFPRQAAFPVSWVSICPGLVSACMLFLGKFSRALWPSAGGGLGSPRLSQALAAWWAVGLTRFPHNGRVGFVVGNRERCGHCSWLCSFPGHIPVLLHSPCQGVHQLPCSGAGSLGSCCFRAGHAGCGVGRAQPRRHQGTGSQSSSLGNTPPLGCVPFPVSLPCSPLRNS